ncbi:hypothetical protein KP509_10G004100 [Ceratopteris richardii]|uniref:Uncharacterized protein n=1 Tax=Ceratopteris richardii TaxID=49495 RepID=A0A8T2TY53_CERRI|nr:hypothetical protein KP509_10G004100 [Ceratopteris richardii]
MGDVKRMGHRRSSSLASIFNSKNNNESNGHHHQGKEFHCWASLRAIFGMVVPSCCVAGHSRCLKTNANSVRVLLGSSSQGSCLTSSIVTGTIFGQRKGRVNFCIQEDPTTPPLFLLEFAMPTHLLVKEMQSGLLRITLVCNKKKVIDMQPPSVDEGVSPSPCSLFSEPVWSMHCNGRKVGFAIKKSVKCEADPAIAYLMSFMQGVATGAGVIPYRSSSCNKRDFVMLQVEKPEATYAMEENSAGDAISAHIDAYADGKHQQNHADGAKVHHDGTLISALNIEESSKEEDGVIYMRAKYESVVGSADSAAFHMMNPDGSQCQELSIFLTRS